MTGTIKAIITYAPANVVFFDNDTSHYKSVSAYGVYTADINRTTLGVNDDVIAGYTVMNDRNSRFIVNIVSASGNNFTFRWSNFTNTSQTIQGIVAIFVVLRLRRLYS